ncbi:MAG: nucleoside triphosphate pyrophosphohydrolase [Deltaproteobacteria bacterium]|nr:nucleoside triphosphate pyrophosphohydrolase [Deltaproteobacteria bacterium]
MKALDELVEVVRRLRAEDGCPWDRAQTPSTMRPYLLEEAYEVLGAIDRGDRDELRRELGDVLFQVVMLAQMAEEVGDFALQDVIAGATDKMVRRHPHVFERGRASEREGWGIAAWEAQKSAERPARQSALDGVPEALPALLRAHRVSEKAGRVGFDWPDVAGVREKLDEEVAELDAAIAGGDEDAIAEELGDVLFTVVNLGRHLPVGAEDALRLATRRFEDRFKRVELALAEQGRTLYDTPADALERIWRAAKGTR